MSVVPFASRARTQPRDLELWEEYCERCVELHQAKIEAQAAYARWQAAFLSQEEA